MDKHIDEKIHSLEQWIDLLRYELKKKEQETEDTLDALKTAKAKLKELKEEKKNGIQGH